MDFILREKYASMFVMSLEDTFENTRYNGGNMKSKRLVAMLMAGCMALSFTACKKEEKSNKESESASQNTTQNGNQNAAQESILYTYDYLKKITPGIDTEGAVVYKVDDFISVGEYKNLSVEIDKSSKNVTDADVLSTLDSLAQYYATTNEIKEGTTKKGDVINLDYSGLKDGVAFDNGTAQDQSYTIGSGRFISDLDAGLEGLEVGKEYSIPCKFPDDYGNEELNGKDVVFVVTVNYIAETVLPEYNDELATKIATDQKFGEDIKTMDQLKEYIKTELQKNAEEIYKQNLFNLAMEQVIASSTFTGKPEGDYTQLTQSLQATFDNYVNQYSAMGITEEQILQYFYQLENKEAFNKYVEETVDNQVKLRLAVLAIAEKEELTVTREAANKVIEEYCSYYNVTKEELEKQLEESDMTASFYVDVYYYGLLDVVSDKILETVVEVDKPATTDTTNEN